MTGIRIEADDAAALAEAWAAAPAIVAEEMAPAIRQASLLLQRETVERTPRGIGSGGGLAGSIRAEEPVVLADTVLGAVGTSLAYAAPVEEGSRPHFPPLQPLRDWVEHVLGLKDETERDRAALGIARKIAARGTEGAHMFKQAFEANRGQVEGMIGRAQARAIERMKKP